MSKDCEFRSAAAWCSLLLIALSTVRCTDGTAPAADAAAGSPAVGPAGGASTSAAGSSAVSVAGFGSAGTSSLGMAGSGGSAPSEPRGPTAATPGVNYPFPQNRHSQFCSYPSYHNSDVSAAYARWKKDTVTAEGAGGHLRVQRPKEPGLEPNSTVSEGIAYGMLLAVYMNDQALFDELWKYEQLWLDKNGLMDWYIDASGSKRLGEGGASDADEDMAWALLMADRQWGGSGSLGKPYLDIAKQQIDLVFRFEIHDYKLLKPGDTWGDWNSVNASYFAPAYYRAFAKASGNDGWNLVLETSYELLAKTLNSANGNTMNGLVPAWSTSEGMPNAGLFKDHPTPTNYQYDSCRTPFRIGLDYCLTGEPRALSYVAKTSQFFAGIGAKQIVDGYNLDGTRKPEHATGQSAAFVGPATVGAMSSSNFRSFLQDGYDNVASLGLLVGGDYYDESWTALSLLMLSGNFLDYTAQSPLLASH